jgi:succinate dehydrogenase / fumarate reductase, cytochrome b subunit
MSLSSSNSTNNIFSRFYSSVVSKLIIAVCGLMLLLFTIVHLLGNLLIFGGTRDKINNYAHSLEKFGLVVNLVELFLFIAGTAHVAYAVAAASRNSKARPQNYRYLKSAGIPSHQSIFSTTMKYTGAILLLFIVFHVSSFKFGLLTTIPYFTTNTGEKIKDIYQLTIQTFQQPSYTLMYIASIVGLSFHLQHGFFSAIQSLGISSPRYTKVFRILSTLISLFIAIGFSSIPICIYFGVLV